MLNTIYNIAIALEEANNNGFHYIIDQSENSFAFIRLYGFRCVVYVCVCVVNLYDFFFCSLSITFIVIPLLFFSPSLTAVQEHFVRNVLKPNG